MRLAHSLRTGFALLCSVGLASFTIREILSYLSYPTTTDTDFVTIEELNFPAVSICSYYYKYAELSKDFGSTDDPSSKNFDTISSDPRLIYTRLDDLNITVDEFIWKYYFTAKEVLDRCVVGGRICTYPEHSDRTRNKTLPDGSLLEVEAEVPAGKVVSRVLADSMLGKNYMCHTLIPNVTVNFAHRGGQGSFMGFSYIKKLREASKTWFVYVHDIHEHVLLHTFGIGNPTHVTMSTTQLHQEFVAARALVTPELYTYPDTSHHPCNSSHSYSSSQCWLNSAWSKRLTRLRGAFGSDMVRCMLPGVLPRPEDVLPICQHSRQSGNISGLGLMDLTRVHHDDETLNATETPIMLASPPIGSELEELANGLADSGKECLERCTVFKYSLSFDASEDQARNFDVLLYFLSKDAKAWSKKESYDFFALLSNIGGMMGLLLGASVLTAVKACFHVASKASKGSKAMATACLSCYQEQEDDEQKSNTTL